MKETLAILIVVTCVVWSALVSVEASNLLFPRLGQSTDRMQRDSSIKNICGRPIPTQNLLSSSVYGSTYLVPVDEKNPDAGNAVLKVPSKVGIPRKRAQAMVTEIANYLRAGNHPNVAKLLGYCKDLSAPLLLLEYIKGKTLDQWRSDNYHNTAVPVETQYTILSQLVDALYWIERRKLVHGDPHYRNILVIESEQKLLIKVIDFRIGADRSDPTKKDSLYLDVRAFCSVAWELARGEEGSNWDLWIVEEDEVKVRQISKKYQDNKLEGPSNPKWVSQLLHMCISALSEKKKKKATSLVRFAKFLGGLAPRAKEEKNAQ